MECGHGRHNERKILFILKESGNMKNRCNWDEDT